MKKRGLIESNPFAEADVRTGSIGNTKRQQYISADDALAVIDELPNAEWRALFAMARFGGVCADAQRAGVAGMGRHRLAPAVDPCAFTQDRAPRGPG